ncbi:MAG: hypothetical protein HFI09_03995 [Bacilli bacterium]|nr:hypothetical protein [Bacilli bacterium]
MNSTENYYQFHIEGEEMKFFDNLRKANVPFDIELSKILINKDLVAVDLFIPWDKIITFLNILYAEVENKKYLLCVYIFDQEKSTLISIPQTIAVNLWHRKSSTHEINKEPQMMKVITSSNEIDYQIFIPYIENWMIYYNPKSPYARIFELGFHKKGVSFIIDRLNPKTNLEVSAINTINAFFESPKGKQYKRMITK